MQKLNIAFNMEATDLLSFVGLNNENNQAHDSIDANIKKTVDEVLADPSTVKHEDGIEMDQRVIAARLQENFSAEEILLLACKEMGRFVTMKAQQDSNPLIALMEAMVEGQGE